MFQSLMYTSEDIEKEYDFDYDIEDSQASIFWHLECYVEEVGKHTVTDEYAHYDLNGGGEATLQWNDVPKHGLKTLIRITLVAGAFAESSRSACLWLG